MFLSHYPGVSLKCPTDVSVYISKMVIHCIHNCVHLYWRFSSAATSVPENEADNGEDDNPEMIITFQLGGDAIGNVPPPLFCLLET